MRMEKEAEVRRVEEEMEREVRKREGKDRVLRRSISDLEAQNKNLRSENEKLKESKRVEEYKLIKECERLTGRLKTSEACVRALERQIPRESAGSEKGRRSQDGRDEGTRREGAVREEVAVG